MVEADDQLVRKRAQEISQKIRSEDGVMCAVNLIESHVLEFGNFKV